jgi:hypothetical protein
MPPFDSIELSGHILVQGKKRGYTEQQVRDCLESPEHIDKSQDKGRAGGFIRKFRKSFNGRTLQIVAEVYQNTCYAITGYWIK